MEHIICRCQNCQKSYTYCTYGNGPQFGTDEGCTREYCAECAKAIQEVLHRIPRKYMGIRQKITDPKEIERINIIFDKCFEKYYQDDIIRIPATRLVGDLGYEKIEGCYIRKTEFQRCTTEDGKVDFYAEKEYDLINDRYTGEYFFRNDNPSEQYFLISQMKFPKDLGKLNVNPMPEPKGELLFMFPEIPEWEVITNYGKKEDVEDITTC